MSKRTQSRGHEAQTAPTSQKTEPASVRPPASSLPRATAAREVPASHSSAGAPSPTHAQISARAYQLWERKGRPDGTDLEDWFEAERQLQTGLR
jgi:hypothetical protein